jgi:hypothetical protein
MLFFSDLFFGLMEHPDNLSENYDNYFKRTSENSFFMTHPMPPSERVHPGGLSTLAEREIRGVFRGSLKIFIYV